jgi:hypothetical protein
MKFSYLDQTPSFVIVFVVFALMLVCNFAGIKFGISRFKKGLKKNAEEIGATESGLLGLLALLLAFTFGSSSTRHEKRFATFIKEADDITVVILKADLYTDSIRSAFRKDIREYAESRLQFYDLGYESEKLTAAIEKSDSIAMNIWKRAVFLSHDKEHIIASNEMLPAIISMIVVAKEQTALTNARVPEFILWILFILCFVATFILGYGLRTKMDTVVIYGFSLMVCLGIYVILDLDRPRRGLINMEKAKGEIVELRKMFIK